MVVAWSMVVSVEVMRSKGSGSGCILTAEPTGYPDRLVRERESSRMMLTFLA